ncbi:MAG TPA: site-specific integrase [Terriglobales bacterium]|nr:site-specific integrase [Terriglobales bacterium]
MTTAIRLHQRLDSKHRYRRIRVDYSRNGSPVAHPHATRFYLLGRLNGRRICLPAGSDVLEADNKRKVLEARLATGAQIPTTMETAATEVPAASERKLIVTEAAAYIERTRRSKKYKTYMGYKDAVELFLSTCKKEYLDELTRDDMITLKQVLQSRFASETVFPMWMKVNTFLNDCHIEKYVNHDTWIQRKDRPVNVSKRNAKNKKYPVYSEHEFAAMLSVADVTEYALLLFLAGSGLRINEAAVAQWCDIDWDAKTVTVREKPEFKFNPKDYEERTIELADSVLTALQAVRGNAPEDELIFPAPRGGINRHLEDRVIVPIIKRANAKGFKVKRPKKPAHALRVLFACRLCQAGVDIETIRVDLGHSDITTTQIYLRAAEKKSDVQRERRNQAMNFPVQLRIAS